MTPTNHTLWLFWSMKAALISIMGYLAQAIHQLSLS